MVRPIDQALLDIERLLAPSVKREREIDPHGSADDKVLEHYVAGAMLCTVVSALEAECLQGATEQTKVVIHIRNAFVHNDSDLAQNRDQSALSDCQAFLTKLQDGRVTTTGDVTPVYYEINGTHVRLLPTATRHVRLVLQDARV